MVFRIVIDANRIIAALIKEGISRAIIFDSRFEFISPDYIIEELNNHKIEIMNKAKIDEKEFDVLLSILFEKITIFPKSEYGSFLDEAGKMIKDWGDIPYLALALSASADGIWSDDKDFLEQDRIKIFSTRDVVGLGEIK